MQHDAAKLLGRLMVCVARGAVFAEMRRRWSSDHPGNASPAGNGADGRWGCERRIEIAEASGWKPGSRTGAPRRSYFMELPPGLAARLLPGKAP
jgi:hypothetical protein